MAWTTPPTFTAGASLTAAQLNILSGNLAVLAGARTSYAATSVWTQATANPVLGNGTIVADYRQVDKEVDFYVQVTIGSTTALGTGTWQLALPVAARRLGQIFIGGAVDVSAGGQAIPIAGEQVSASLLLLREWPATAGGGFLVVNNTQPIATPATGDTYTISGRYEAA